MKSLLATGLATACLLFGSINPTQAAAPIDKPVGLQLYSLRAQFIKNVPETLKTVEKFGIKEAELAGTYNIPPAKFRQMLEERGIKAVSGHFPYARWKTEPDAVAAEAKTLGLKFAGCAWIDHTGAFDEAQCRDAAAVFNRAGEAARKQGITFFYHVHGFEFETFGSGTLLDLLFAETKPELVSYQMDILWIVFPGQDPVALLKKYPKRWSLMHLKDLRKGVATGSLAGKTDVTNDVALGAGQMNWPAILAEARKVGIKHYFIEDESPVSEQQIPQSLDFLKNLQF